MRLHNVSDLDFHAVKVSIPGFNAVAVRYNDVVAVGGGIFSLRNNSRTCGINRNVSAVYVDALVKITLSFKISVAVCRIYK